MGWDGMVEKQYTHEPDYGVHDQDDDGSTKETRNDDDDCGGPSQASGGWRRWRAERKEDAMPGYKYMYVQSIDRNMGTGQDCMYKLHVYLGICDMREL